MARQAKSYPPLSPALHTPARQDHSFCRPTIARSSSDEAAAAPSASLHQQHQSVHHSASYRPQPYSEGMFGRQRAEQRAQASVPSHHHMPSDCQNSPRPVLYPAPLAQQGQSPIAPQLVPDGLDRFNARRSKCSAPSATSLEPVQQSLDALDRFNARKGFAPQASAPRKGTAASGGLVSDRLKSHSGIADTGRASQDSLAQVPQPMLRRVDQMPGQSAASEPVQQQQQAQCCLDALDRFNRRKGSKLSNSSEAPAQYAAVQSGLHSMPRPQDQQTLDNLNRHKRLQPQLTPKEEQQSREIAADDSQQSQSTMVEPQHVCKSGHGKTVPAMAEGFTATHMPDALDRVNSVLLARRNSRTDAPAAKRCRPSASPDAQESSTHALTGVQCDVNWPVDVSVHQFEPVSAAQACKTGAAPSGMYSSRPCTNAPGSKAMGMAYIARDRPPSSNGLRSASAWHNAAPSNSADALQTSAGLRRGTYDAARVPVGKKRMRAFENDDDGDEHIADLSPTKKSKVATAASALYDSRKPGKQHNSVFMRLAKQSD